MYYDDYFRCCGWSISCSIRTLNKSLSFEELANKLCRKKNARMAFAADLAPPHIPRAFFGFWTTVGDLGAIIGPMMCGVLADIYGLSSPFYGTVMLIAVGGITTQLFFRDPKNEKIESRTR